MIFKKNALEDLVTQTYGFVRLKDDYIGRGLSSRNIRIMSKPVQCIGCGSRVKAMYFMNKVWRCASCQGFVYRGTNRNVLFEEVACDLQEFFGVLDTKALLNKESIDSFMYFTGYEDNVLKKTVLIMLLRAVAQAEFSVLELLLRTEEEHGGFTEDNTSEQDS